MKFITYQMTRARTWKLPHPKRASYQIDFHLFYIFFYIPFLSLFYRGFYFEDDDTAVGRSTSALRYTRIKPISPPNTELSEPPRRTGANNKKINEINPKIIYNA
jgi:hypothetical protein